jgi:hypothetical protein
MGVKDTMNNFFTSMTGQISSGSSQKNITTPMGPFTWDDNLQMWVNTNNGMVMSNIAFQDQFAMMDYDVTNETGVANLYDALTLSPATWGDLSSSQITVTQNRFASSSGPQLLPSANTNRVQFIFAEGTPTITISITSTITGSGTAPSLLYAKNNISGGVVGLTTYSAPFTITANDTLAVGIAPAASSSGTGSLIVTNTTTGIVLGTITVDYAVA